METEGEKQKQNFIFLKGKQLTALTNFFLKDNDSTKFPLSSSELPHSNPDFTNYLACSIELQNNFAHAWTNTIFPHWNGLSVACSLVTLALSYVPTTNLLCELNPNPKSVVAGKTNLWMKTVQQPIRTQNLDRMLLMMRQKTAVSSR